MSSESTTPPLAGTRIIELAGIGPGPFAAMMLADMGAEVITGILFRSRVPRFDGHPPTAPRPRRAPGADTVEVLGETGFSPTEIESLLADGVIDSTP